MTAGVCVKFCGLRRREDVAAAVRLGVDYLGFVFVPGGPRSLEPERAADLLQAIDTGAARRVGVFRDQPARFVNEIVARCRLDLVQLHGVEPRDYPAALDVPVLRVVRAPAVAEDEAGAATVGAATAGAATAGAATAGATRATVPSALRAVRLGQQVPLAPNVFAVLVDAEDGSGRSGGLGLGITPASLERVLENLPRAARVFVAGGLSAHNVGTVVQRFHPYGVDVASGVESAPGIKDPRRMAAFMAALGRMA